MLLLLNVVVALLNVVVAVPIVSQQLVALVTCQPQVHSSSMY